MSAEKSTIWFPVAVGATVLNLIGVGFYFMTPAHATVHAVLALGFGLWAQRLRRDQVAATRLEPGEDIAALQAGLEALELEVGKLRQELSDAQERLDFAERVLAQGRDARRVGPQ